MKKFITYIISSALVALGLVGIQTVNLVNQKDALKPASAANESFWGSAGKPELLEGLKISSQNDNLVKIWSSGRALYKTHGEWSTATGYGGLQYGVEIVAWPNEGIVYGVAAQMREVSDPTNSTVNFSIVQTGCAGTRTLNNLTVTRGGNMSAKVNADILGCASGSQTVYLNMKGLKDDESTMGKSSVIIHYMSPPNVSPTFFESENLNVTVGDSITFSSSITLDNSEYLDRNITSYYGGNTSAFDCAPENFSSMHGQPSPAVFTTQCIGKATRAGIYTYTQYFNGVGGVSYYSDITTGGEEQPIFGNPKFLDDYVGIRSKVYNITVNRAAANPENSRIEISKYPGLAEPNTGDKIGKGVGFVEVNPLWVDEYHGVAQQGVVMVSCTGDVSPSFSDNILRFAKVGASLCYFYMGPDSSNMALKSTQFYTVVEPTNPYFDLYDVSPDLFDVWEYQDGYYQGDIKIRGNLLDEVNRLSVVNSNGVEVQVYETFLNKSKNFLTFNNFAITDIGAYKFVLRNNSGTTKTLDGISVIKPLPIEADPYESNLDFTVSTGSEYARRDVQTVPGVIDIDRGFVKLDVTWRDEFKHFPAQEGTASIVYLGCAGTANPGYDEVNQTITFKAVGEGSCSFDLRNIAGRSSVRYTPIYKTDNYSMEYLLYYTTFDLRNLPNYVDSRVQLTQSQMMLTVSGEHLGGITQISIENEIVDPSTWTTNDYSIVFSPAPDRSVGPENNSRENPEDKTITVVGPLGMITGKIGYYLTAAQELSERNSWIEFETNRGTTRGESAIYFREGYVNVIPHYLDAHNYPTDSRGVIVEKKTCNEKANPTYNDETGRLTFGAVGQGVCIFQFNDHGFKFGEFLYAYETMDYDDTFSLNPLVPESYDLRYPDTTVTLTGAGFRNDMRLLIDGKEIDHYIDHTSTSPSWAYVNPGLVLLYGLPKLPPSHDNEPYSVVLQRDDRSSYADIKLYYTAAQKVNLHKSWVEFIIHRGEGSNLVGGKMIDQATGWVELVPHWLDVNGWEALPLEQTPEIEVSFEAHFVPGKNYAYGKEFKLNDGSISINFGSVGTSEWSATIGVKDGTWGSSIWPKDFTKPVGDDGTTTVFHVDDLKKAFLISGVTPERFDTRKPGTTITIEGIGFDYLTGVYFGGQEVPAASNDSYPTYYTLVNSKTILIKNLVLPQAAETYTIPVNYNITVTRELYGASSQSITFFYELAQKASIQESYLKFIAHRGADLGSSESSVPIDQKTGFIEVIPIWLDTPPVDYAGNPLREPYPTILGIGSVEFVTCTGSSGPHYINGKLSFDHVGIVACTFGMRIPHSTRPGETLMALRTQTFIITDLIYDLGVKYVKHGSLANNLIDVRDLGKTLTIAGFGFNDAWGVKVYINGTRISSNYVETVGHDTLYVHALPNLSPGTYELMVESSEGLAATLEIMYFYIPTGPAYLETSSIEFVSNGGLLLDRKNGLVQANPIWRDVNGYLTTEAVGNIQYCSTDGTAGITLNGNQMTFISPGTAIMTCVLHLRGMSKTLTSPTYTVTTIEDPLTLLQISPNRFDIRDSSSRTVVVYGSGFTAPLHFYVDDTEVLTPNISIFPAGDVILNIEMPEMPVGVHLVKISTPKGVVTTSVEYYDSWPLVPTESESINYQYNIIDVGGLTVGRKSAIGWLAKQQITVGCEIVSTVGTFISMRYCPKNPVNRGAMAEFLFKVDKTAKKQAKTLAVPETEPFVDLDGIVSGRVAAIAWLDAQAVTQGCNTKGTKYCPGNAVNRGAMAEFLFKLAGASKTYKNYSPKFSDIGDLTKERVRAINWMKDMGITVGFGKPDVYGPWEPVNRGSMAEFLQRYYNKFKVL
ncbi:MAG: IPT/TIG domain-containing protein [Bifidobacteriaceae bacterium]|jgi:hypothetical protein|nr:IPT/TIG domain-containing protein [Bifidobacteriaceae bacterium]